MNTPLTLTERELSEVQHCLYYYQSCNHGTVGHNLLVIVAKFALDKGFKLNPMTGGSMVIPETIVETK